MAAAPFLPARTAWAITSSSTTSTANARRVADGPGHAIRHPDRPAARDLAGAGQHLAARRQLEVRYGLDVRPFLSDHVGPEGLAVGGLGHTDRTGGKDPACSGRDARHRHYVSRAGGASQDGRE